MALTWVQRKYYQGKIVAYFKKNGNVLRYKLFAIDKRFVNTKFRVKDNFPYGDFNLINNQIDELEQKVDEAIKYILSRDTKAVINKKIIDDVIDDIIEDKTDEKGSGNILLHGFSEFIEGYKKDKSDEDERNGIKRSLHPSVKDYISTLNSLTDFEFDRRAILYLEDVNDDFVEEYMDYLFDERISTQEHKYLSKGKLVNATVNKRLDCFAHFLKEYYKNIELAYMVLSHKQKKLAEKSVIRLTKPELDSLAKMNLSSESEERIRDFFVFLCSTGLRFSDFIRINKSNFQSLPIGDGVENCLYLYTQKTDCRAKITLTEHAMNLAIKYDYDFSYYTNQAFNRGLKALFEKYDLYGDIVHKLILQRKKEKIVKMKRRECISAHTGRRTFISILIENGVQISDVMAMTGHTKESTLNIYIERFSKDLRESVKPLEIK